MAPPRRNGLTWVLGVLAVVLLAGIAVGTVLLLDARQQRAQRVADQRAHIAELKQKLEEQNGEIRCQEVRIGQSEADLAEALDKLKNPCTAAVQELWNTPKRGDFEGVVARTTPMVSACGAKP